MDGDRAILRIKRMALVFLLGNGLLILTASTAASTVLIGTLIGQVGLCCGALLRNSSLREGALGLLLLLVSGAGLLPVAFNNIQEAGYLLIATLIITTLSITMNLVPTLLLRRVYVGGRFQFSIGHIMVLMAIVGTGTLLVTFWGIMLLGVIIPGLIYFGPAAVGSFLIATVKRSSILVLPLSAIALLGIAVWVQNSNMGWTGQLVFAQVVTLIGGGIVLLFVEPESRAIPETSSAATASPSPFDSVPGPFDEP